MRDIARLPATYRSAVGTSIDDLAVRPLDGKPLRGRLAHLRSLRVGVYRVLYTFEPRSKTVTVETVRHRGEAYRVAR